jgi:uncharacterized protein YndB with AHSA1/START domain
MDVQPTGRVERSPDGGVVLTVERTLASPPLPVWATLTEPDRTARWFGVWKGEPGEGRTVHLRAAFEDGAPWSDVLIRTCRPPERLDVEVRDTAGDWALGVTLEPVAGGTRLELTQHLTDATAVGDIGPGWEYYLDMLVAAHTGGPHPKFEDYHPAQSQHFVAQI